jgi:tetratricopeptide (TPR) repeat protein
VSVRSSENRPIPRPALYALVTERRGAAALATALALLVALAAGMGGCSADRDAATQRSVTALPDPDDGELLGEELMIALSLAKNYHHKADVLAQEARYEEAAEALRQILAIPFPADAPEAADVRLDARARLGKLLASQGRIDDALIVIEQGLAEHPQDSFFRANLFTVKGEVHEAQATALDQGGTEATRAAARDARRAAITAFDESIRINRALQEALLREGAP